MSDLRHATTEELLALRDGEGGAWTKEHVQKCTTCARELWRLEQLRARLRALPAYAPPRDLWPAVAATARRDRRQRWARGLVALSTAAALAGIAFAALRPASGGPTASQQAALAREIARSQALETQLRALDPERQALTADAANAAAELQSRLAAVDAQLNVPEAWTGDQRRITDLWAQRAGLLSALVDVHTTRVAAAGL
jgi:hypothetical protein